MSLGLAQPIRGEMKRGGGGLICIFIGCNTPAAHLTAPLCKQKLNSHSSLSITTKYTSVEIINHFSANFGCLMLKL